MSVVKCQYCQAPLGMGRRLAGARYCSDGHSRADQDQMQRLIIARLNKETDRLRERFRNPYPHRSIDDMKALTLALAS